MFVSFRLSFWVLSFNHNDGRLRLVTVAAFLTAAASAVLTARASAVLTAAASAVLTAAAAAV